MYLHGVIFNKKDKLKGLKIPNKVTPALAYLCGIFAGDGSISNRKQKNEYLLKCVGNPKDEKPLYHQIIGPLFKETFGFLPSIRHCDNGDTFGFIIYSKNLIYYLTEHIGLPSGKKYASLKIPSIFLKNETLLTHFIRGIFDTDGCISCQKPPIIDGWHVVIRTTASGFWRSEFHELCGF